MLAEFIPQLPDLLPEPGVWHPYPTAGERAGWDALPGDLRTSLVEQGEFLLGCEWPSLPASLFLEFARMGNRSRYEKAHFARRYQLEKLVLAECVEGMGRFLDDITNGVWAVCEETYWGVPAHVNAQEAGAGLPDAAEPTVDLFAAETVALLAWTDYLLGRRLDIVSPLVRQRIRLEAKRRVLDPCLARDDFWWMSFDTRGHGINNWNPWVNSNWLAAVLLLETDRERQLATVAKILRSLDLFIATYAEAGGCDEGPGYWGRAAASLFDCLEQLYGATGGRLSVYDRPKIQNMGRFIYRTHISRDYYVNFADASAANHPAAGLVYRYGERIADADMMGFGAWLAGEAGPALWVRRDSLSRWLPALFKSREIAAYPASQPLPGCCWFDGIQVLAARENPGRAAGLFLAAKGGHNAESHNHNDVGSFIVYTNGLPLVVDAGVETYTRQTFSERRYEIWTMQSAYHSLLPSVVNQAGTWMQAPGKEFAAREVSSTLAAGKAVLNLDIAGAYPPEAGISRWLRAITLADGAVRVEDAYKLDEAPGEVQLGLLTPCKPTLTSPGVLALAAVEFGDGRRSGAGQVRYPAELFEVAFETVPITDERLGGVWGQSLNRVLFTAAAPPAAGGWVFTFGQQET